MTGQALLYGLQVTLVGMAVVFVALVILIGLISLLKLIFYRDGGAKKKEAETEGAPARPSDPQAPVVQAQPVQDATLVAVITAAVAAMMGQDVAQGGFVVRNIRRVKNAPAWNRAGREEQIYNRF